jgi:exosortase A-associated hydrolase 2
MTLRVEPSISSSDAGHLAGRFCFYSEPTETPPKALIVYLPPWAEEMNKSRRMAALQARALAQEGCLVLQLDPLGCGDSAGDFADAIWADWVDDFVGACTLVEQRFRSRWPLAPLPPLWLWALRAGCLLAADVAERWARPCHFLFWQPSPSGKAVLQQFLRLDSVAAVFGKSTGTSARERLGEGSRVLIAGYELTPVMADGLDSARLRPSAHAASVDWFEIAAQPDATPSPAVQKSLSAWTQAEVPLRHHIVCGPAFWQSTEIEVAPALLDATCAALREALALAPAVHP